MHKCWVYDIIIYMKTLTEKRRYTEDDLNAMSKKDLLLITLSLQDQIQQMNENFEQLIEQLRIANQNRFGRHSEKLDAIDGQMSLFNEAEDEVDPSAGEPPVEEVVKSYKRKRKKGKLEADLSGFPKEEVPHTVSREILDAFYGPGNWKKMPTEEFNRLRYEPASWTVEHHTVEVYVGTGGLHQDEFFRANRPKDLIQKSIATPSLGAAILNGKYVNAMPLYRISQEFERHDLNLSRQTLANWVIAFSKYFKPLWERMKYHLLQLPVTQADETPLQVIHDGGPPGSKSYMWVHRSGEYFRDKPIVLYEYQRTRHHEHPLSFYKGYKGVLVTDGLQQYHLVEQKIDGLTNANCWAHARRDFADACKAIGKTNTLALKASVAHQALELIAGIYHADEALKDLSAEERLEQRKIKVEPLVDAFFLWIREQLSSGASLPKGKTAEGLNYCLNHERYLRIFLTDGNVPIDNSASERAIRPFCIGKKNWVVTNTEKGAEASALAYSIAESAKLNNLKPYDYFKHLLTELPDRMDDKDHIDPETLDDLMPWASELPEVCHKRR